MIDEGHDFEPAWLCLVTQMTDPEQDFLLLLYVGMTRAKEQLLLTSSEPNPFTERLTALAA